MPETITILKTTDSQRKQFNCGVHDLNDFLKRHSVSNHLNGLGRTFVLVMNDSIVGYYTICMGNTLEFAHVEHKTTLPKYPIPIALLAKLAVCKHKQGMGIGKWMLIDAIHRILNAAEEIGAFAIVVDAKDEQAKSYYMQYGFIPFPKKPLSLYMLLASTAELVNEKTSMDSVHLTQVS